MNKDKFLTRMSDQLFGISTALSVWAFVETMSLQNPVGTNQVSLVVFLVFANLWFSLHILFTFIDFCENFHCFLRKALDKESMKNDS